MNHMGVVLPRNRHARMGLAVPSRQGVTMPRFVRVTPDSTREELIEAVAHLRAKRAACELPVIQTEIDDDVDELVALIVARESQCA